MDQLLHCGLTAAQLFTLGHKINAGSSKRVPEIPDVYETRCDVPDDELEWQTEMVEERVEL